MNIYSGRCTFSTLTVSSNLPTCKARLAQVTWACCFQSLAFMKVELLLHFCDDGHRFSTGWSHNELKTIWCIVGQQTFCHKVQSFLFFACFFCRIGKLANTSSSFLRSFHVYRKLNGRQECKVLCEAKGTA